MRQDHPKVATDSQLPIITARSGGPAADIFEYCPLCTWSPEPDANPEDAARDIDGSGTRKIDIRHAKDAERTKRKMKLQQHIAEHLQYVALRALPDVLFETSIRSRSSASSSSTDSGDSELSISENEIHLLQQEDSCSTDGYPIEQTEGEDWAWVYNELSLASKLDSRKPCEPRSSPCVLSCYSRGHTNAYHSHLPLSR